MTCGCGLSRKPLGIRGLRRRTPLVAAIPRRNAGHGRSASPHRKTLARRTLRYVAWTPAAAWGGHEGIEVCARWQHLPQTVERSNIAALPDKYPLPVLDETNGWLGR